MTKYVEYRVVKLLGHPIYRIEYRSPYSLLSARWKPLKEMVVGYADVDWVVKEYATLDAAGEYLKQLKAEYLEKFNRTLNLWEEIHFL